MSLQESFSGILFRNPFRESFSGIVIFVSLLCSISFCFSCFSDLLSSFPILLFLFFFSYILLFLFFYSYLSFHTFLGSYTLHGDRSEVREELAFSGYMNNATDVFLCPTPDCHGSMVLNDTSRCERFAV